MSLPMPPEPFASLIGEWARSLKADNKTIRNYTDAVCWFHIWCAEPIAPPDETDPPR